MTVFNNNGTIAINFNHLGKRFVLSGLGDYGDASRLQKVKDVELRIKQDRKSNNFPFDNNESVRLYYFPSTEDKQQMIARTIATERRVDKLNPPLLEVWDKWVLYLALPQATQNNHYHCSRQMILKSGSPKAQDVNWFENLRSSFSAKVFNHRKTMLKSCLEWAINNDLVSGKNPYQALKPKKNERNDHVQPFSKDEIVASKKILKTTKTGAVGFIPMNELLYDILHDHKPSNANSTDWVFKGHQGDYISTASFRDTWKLVLTGLGIEYRYPYQMKHTALSFVATQQGLLAASKLARHKNVTMVAKHYARFVDEVKLPDYGI